MIWNICSSGHLYEFMGRPHCPFCQAQWVWESDDIRDVAELEIKEAPVTRVCDLGCEHTLAPATYVVPERGRVR